VFEKYFLIEENCSGGLYARFQISLKYTLSNKPKNCKIYILKQKGCALNVLQAG